MPQTASCFTKRKCLLAISACLTVAMRGQNISGSVYADYFKLKLLMSQKQVDFSMIMLYFGSILSFLSGIVFDRFGATATVIIGSFLSISSSLSLSAAFAHPDFLRHHLWMLNSLLFLYSHSLNYAYVAAIATCMSVFHERGFMMSALSISYILSSPVVAFLYFAVFRDPNKSVQNPCTTMFSLACYSIFVHTMAFFFVRKNTSEVNEETPILLDKTDQTPFLIDEIYMEDENGEVFEGGVPSVPESDWSAICSLRFMILVMGFALIVGSSSVIIVNVTTINRSLNLSEYDLMIFWVCVPFIALFQASYGTLVDKFTSRASQCAFLLTAIAGIAGSIGLGLLIVPVIGSGMATMIMSFIFNHVCSAAMAIMIPPLLSVAESPSAFGRMYSVCILVETWVSLPLSLQFGAFYDSHSHRLSSNGTQTVCYGQECYASGAITLLAVHLLGVASLGVYGVVVKNRSK